MPDLNEFATAFLSMFTQHRLEHALPPISELSIEDAYTVQDRVLATRITQGERVVGYKVGCTSTAIRQQFGVHEPICGRLLEPHVHRGSEGLPWSRYFQPAVEPEFVLTVARDFPDGIAADQPLDDAIASVAPGIEIHNFHFWCGESTLQELIASNGIHAALVVGEARPVPAGFTWEMEGVGLFKNGQLADSGIGAEIMGNPLTSLRWLINHLHRRGQVLRAGDLVIPGSPVELVSVAPGDTVTAAFTRLGEVTTRFVE